jgi:ankyrin repeat protein
MRSQSGRLIELQILIAMAFIAVAVFVPRVMGGEGVLMSLLVAFGWVVAIVGGFLALAFLAELPEMVRDWRTTPSAVRAARKRNVLEALQKIDPQRLDVRAADRFGNTALHVVCDSYEEERKRGAPDIVDFLLRHGADVNAANTYEKTPLELAVQHEYGADTVRRLLAAGARPQDALNDAAAKSGGDAMEVVKALLDAGASVGVANVLGTTPLHQAASYGGPETIREFVARGAEINARDNAGITPLHAALWMPSLNEQRAADIISVLVAAGADRDAKDNRGRTPRALAEGSGISAVIAAMNGV